MPTTLYTVDSFTNVPFAGNPAAVCVLDSPRDEGWMQSVAAEMNLSETAFLWPEGDCWRLRWFTPTVEVDLCGHATLASAHILWAHGYANRAQALQFSTRSGILGACTDNDWIELDFPADPPTATEPIPALAALGTTPVWVGRNSMDVFVRLDTAAQVRALTPDMTALARIATRGIVVTALSDDPRYDFVSRFFGPAVGVNEDPVTGSAHSGLAPYWGAVLDKRDMVGMQCSARGGIVKTALQGDRVLLCGQAVTMMKAELLV